MTKISRTKLSQPTSVAPPTRDELLVDGLLGFFSRDKRTLPWRAQTGYPPAYHVLVSELMLQQTQVATVVDYFRKFIAAFPTVHDLARADTQQVLRIWQGLGYYARARNLHKAAQKIVNDFNGIVPDEVDTLLTLPGVGRYTAGAIASLAYGKAQPMVDGNVMRVLSRLEAALDDPREASANKKLWKRSTQLVQLAGSRAADFNSSLMELGATICTPKRPACMICPVRQQCRSLEQGLVDQIPPAKIRKGKPQEVRDVFGVSRLRRGVLEWAVEQRPASGRWAGLWQFITKVADDQSTKTWRASAQPLGEITHLLTHRRYLFRVWICPPEMTIDHPTCASGWASAARLSELPMPKPQLDIGRMLALARPVSTG